MKLFVKKFININWGITRIVFLIGKYAIKIPNLKNGHLHFLYGCFANYSERNYCKLMKNVENNKYYNLVAPSLFCSWFGLIQIQIRCIVNENELTDEELLYFENVRDGETKPNNFGFLNGRLVCLDYPM